MKKETGWSKSGKHYTLPSGTVVEADAYGIVNPAKYSGEALAEWDTIADAEEAS